MKRSLTAAGEATHTLWDQPVRRDPENDSTSGTSEAWRFVTLCDEGCHHPVHAFGTPRGAQHLEWFEPGTAPVTPIPAEGYVTGLLTDCFTDDARRS